MIDTVERLRVWPAAYGEDALSSTYVEKMAKEAADEIERLRRRVTVLEMVIAEEMHPADCHDEANAMIVEEIYKRPKSSETQGQGT